MKDENFHDQTLSPLDLLFTFEDDKINYSVMKMATNVTLLQPVQKFLSYVPICAMSSYYETIDDGNDDEIVLNIYANII